MLKKSVFRVLGGIIADYVLTSDDICNLTQLGILDPNHVKSIKIESRDAIKDLGFIRHLSGLQHITIAWPFFDMDLVEHLPKVEVVTMSTGDSCLDLFIDAVKNLNNPFGSTREEVRMWVGLSAHKIIVPCFGSNIEYGLGRCIIFNQGNGRFKINPELDKMGGMVYQRSHKIINEPCNFESCQINENTI